MSCCVNHQVVFVLWVDLFPQNASDNKTKIHRNANGHSDAAAAGSSIHSVKSLFIFQGNLLS